ncbi:hypothetical protein [Actinomadura sp. DC4]|uniref:hypothetical protein n=1 Tax=Actinomadura sp. DC4 TaxID=3055069 RepID=UPI0025B22430|nr:hypothetical protein [Actinomadura sp. DC4]MDN3359590.1 hypothetical protein [Actinomadura sp. DC4]
MTTISPPAREFSVKGGATGLGPLSYVRVLGTAPSFVPVAGRDITGMDLVRGPEPAGRRDLAGPR